MKVNFNQPIKDPFGNAVTDEFHKPQTIGRILATGLFNAKQLKGMPLTPEQKFLAYNLSTKIANADNEIEITVEDAQFIKNLSADIFMAGVYGNIVNLIEK